MRTAKLLLIAVLSLVATAGIAEAKEKPAQQNHYITGIVRDMPNGTVSGYCYAGTEWVTDRDGKQRQVYYYKNCPGHIHNHVNLGCPADQQWQCILIECSLFKTCGR